MVSLGVWVGSEEKPGVECPLQAEVILVQKMEGHSRKGRLTMVGVAQKF